jgi:hypothetical protein
MLLLPVSENQHAWSLIRAAIDGKGRRDGGLDTWQIRILLGVTQHLSSRESLLEVLVEGIRQHWMEQVCNWNEGKRKQSYRLVASVSGPRTFTFQSYIM